MYVNKHNSIHSVVNTVQYHVNMTSSCEVNWNDSKNGAAKALCLFDVNADECSLK